MNTKPLAIYSPYRIESHGFWLDKSFPFCAEETVRIAAEIFDMFFSENDTSNMIFNLGTEAFKVESQGMANENPDEIKIYFIGPFTQYTGFEEVDVDMKEYEVIYHMDYTFEEEDETDEGQKQIKHWITRHPEKLTIFGFQEISKR